MNLNNKTAWITGASGGIGKELAVQLAQAGAQIILTARNEVKLREVRDQLVGDNHLVFPMDLLQVEAIPAAVSNALGQVGSVDLLINNAGITQRALAKDTDFAVDRKIMELDYFAVIALTKALLPHFLDRQRGQIVTISSVTGKMGVPMRTAYCAAKHAVFGFMDALRAEVAHDNIQVLVVAPGSVKTDISINALEGDGSKHNVVDPLIANGMPVEVCARKIVRAIERKRPELLIAQGKTKWAVYARRFAPRLLFRMMAKAQTV